jgi:plastocyanin
MRRRRAIGASILVAAVGFVGVGGLWPGRTGADASVSAALGSAANEFSLVLLPAEVPAGDVVLVATNGGAEEHTLSLKGGTPTAEIAPGGSEPLAVGTLAAGTYTFVCTIAGHEQLGMKADLTVTDEGATSTTVSIATTTTLAGGSTSTSVAGVTSTTSSGAATTTTLAAGSTTTSSGARTTTTAVAEPASRLSETGPRDVWPELVAGLVVLNAGYLLWSATRPARRRGRLTG